MKKLFPLVLMALIGSAMAQDRWNREGEISTDLNSYAEFAFTRIIFSSGYQPITQTWQYGVARLA